MTGLLAPVLMYHLIGAPPREDCLVEPRQPQCAAAVPTPLPAPPEAVERCRRLTAGLSQASEPAPAPPSRLSAGESIASDPYAHMEVGADEFEAQMRRLHEEGWRTLTLEEWRARPREPHAVVLTFDDGYEDNYTTAFPILKRYGLRANLFMVSDNVGRPGRLSAGQLREMDAAGFRVYAHTKSHPVLPELDARRQCEELLASKLELEALLGRAVDYLAYPYGRYAPGVTDRLARETGYAAAFSTAPGRCDPDGPRLYSCERYGVSRVDPSSFERALGQGPGQR